MAWKKKSDILATQPSLQAYNNTRAQSTLRFTTFQLRVFEASSCEVRLTCLADVVSRKAEYLDVQCSFHFKFPMPDFLYMESYEELIRGRFFFSVMIFLLSSFVIFFLSVSTEVWMHHDHDLEFLRVGEGSAFEGSF